MTKILIYMSNRSPQAMNKFIVPIIAVAFLLTSCMSGVDNPYQPKSSALGKMNEIVIVSDDTIWQGMVGDTIRYYLGGTYPITPRPEPLFDLRHFEAGNINQERLLRELRTYLIVADINDEDSDATKMLRKDIGEEKFRSAQSDPEYRSSVGKNKWANGQLLIYVFGTSQQDVANQIAKNFEVITQRVHKHDKIQLKSMTYAKGENKGLSQKIRKEYGVEINMPLDYRVAKEVPEENFLWLRQDDKYGAVSMIIKKMKYQDESQLSKENMKLLRNTYGKKYVSSKEPNSYMQTNDRDLPILEYSASIAGNYGKEFRGIWEMENDFIGGPFISYLFLSKDKKDLIFIDAWVFAPGKTKRNKLQQLEHMIRTAS